MVNINTAIFDCDGVILRSNKIKTNAFKEVLSDEPKELVDVLINYHKDNGGISRFKKFNYYYYELKKDKHYISKSEKAIKLFSEVIFSKLLDIDLVPGVLKYLKYLNNQGVLCVVNSGSEENELKKIFNIRGLDEYFNMIFGSPSTKKKNIERMCNVIQIKEPIVFYGDSITDYNIAKQFNMNFVYIYCDSEWSDGKKICKESGSRVYLDFREVFSE